MGQHTPGQNLRCCNLSQMHNPSKQVVPRNYKFWFGVHGRNLGSFPNSVNSMFSIEELFVTVIMLGFLSSFRLLQMIFYLMLSCFNFCSSQRFLKYFCKGTRSFWYVFFLECFLLLWFPRNDFLYFFQL